MSKPDDVPYAEIYDRLMSAEATIARIEALLAPHVAHDVISGRSHEISKVHVRARDLRAALNDTPTTRPAAKERP